MAVVKEMATAHLIEDNAKITVAICAPKAYCRWR